MEVWQSSGQRKQFECEKRDEMCGGWVFLREQATEGENEYAK